MDASGLSPQPLPDFKNFLWQLPEGQIFAPEMLELGAAVYGLHDGQKAWVAARAAQDRQLLVIANTEKDAERLGRDMTMLLGQDIRLLPGATPTLKAVESQNRLVAGQRIDALLHLLQGGSVVATVEALQATLCPPRALEEAVISLHVGQVIPPETLVEALLRAGYLPEAAAESAGQFCRRAGILDCMEAGGSFGLRVEFFDDEIDSLRLYDPATQRTIEMVQTYTLRPATLCPMDAPTAQQGLTHILEDFKKQYRSLCRQQERQTTEADILPWEEDADAHAAAAFAADAPERLRLRAEGLVPMESGMIGTLGEDFLPYFYEPATIADYLSPQVLVIFDEPIALRTMAEHIDADYAELCAQALENGDTLPLAARMMLPAEELFAQLCQPAWITLMTVPHHLEAWRPEAMVNLQSQPALHYFGRMDVMLADILRWRSDHAVAIFTGTPARAKELQGQLLDEGVSAWCGVPDRAPELGEVVLIPHSLSTGFVCEDWKLAVLTHNDWLGTPKEAPKPRKGRSLEESRRIFADLSPGDYVVHEAHGVAQFVDMVTENTAGVMREYMLLEYRGGDRLYVPTEQLERINRYMGRDDHVPTLSSMGSREWSRTKNNVRTAVRKVAEGLVELYAQRRASEGFAFSADTPWQTEFENRFIHEETPDQLQSIEEIKADMQSRVPMDRLLCGDVGYGKTEVAMRAAFKAVQDSRQVAVLVPTTLLAQQHFLNFSERFAGYPVRVEMLSRFRTPAQQKAILADLTAGKVDILIGTHALLSNAVQFAELGLLVVDEEQRFGVNHKEKIKRLRQNVDVLTLTATPIPRTLHMSMVGIRDLSVIDTPPQERLPVQTVVMPYSDALVREAITREVGRGGQVFVLNNRVVGIERCAQHLRELVPKARLVVGHGQMPQEMLENVTLQFIRGEADVLVSTTIIENGLDIPNANTLIILDADRLGLAQLYQLRGRVGRSSRTAYAYLTHRPGAALSPEAQKRLSAIREFTQLGSGFRIAMRDLEIRGAGNILGAEQSGQIAAIGYDLYCRLIDEEVRRLKGEEIAPQAECTLDLRTDAYLPESYIADERRRLAVYRKLAVVTDEDQLSDAIDELTDRFGDPPACVLMLCSLAMLRALAMRCGVKMVSGMPHAIVLRFHVDAKVEVPALLAAIGQTKGAKLQAGGTPRAILSFDSKADMTAMVAGTMDFLKKVK